MDIYEEKTEKLRLLLLETGFGKIANESELEDLSATLATSLLQGNEKKDMLELLVAYFGCPHRLSSCGLLLEMTKKLKKTKI